MPVPALFATSAVSQYGGAAMAVLLFARMPAASVAWLRVLAAAVVLQLALRVGRRTGTRPRSLVTVGFGLALAVMNLSFYLAIDRLPLGTAVAIEFLGPIGVAAALSRTRAHVSALALTVVGVGLLADVRLAGSAAGVAFALLAALGWAAYVLLGARVAGGSRGLRGLGTAMSVAAVALTPVGLAGAAPALADPRLLAAATVVGVLSSVVPYGLDQLALRRVSPGRFALLLALLPVTATLVGAVALGQRPSAQELWGIAAVTAAVALRGRGATA